MVMLLQLFVALCALTFAVALMGVSAWLVWFILTPLSPVAGWIGGVVTAVTMLGIGVNEGYAQARRPTRGG
jgi:hypothetical protein